MTQTLTPVDSSRRVIPAHREPANAALATLHAAKQPRETVLSPRDQAEELQALGDQWKVTEAVTKLSEPSKYA